MEDTELKKQAAKIRKHVVTMAAYSKSSHVGSALSMVDVLTLLYFKVLRVDPVQPRWQERDRFLLSKAHGSSALYATLAERGFFNTEILSRYYIDGGILPGHLDHTAVPGIEFSAGSLGHGLSAGIGFALALRQDAPQSQVYVLVGDGECNEGSIWEAAMLAGHLKISNLTVLIDYNRIQSFGRTNDVLDQRNLKARWESFGWHAVEVDGHDFQAMQGAFAAKQVEKHERPKAIVLDTIKGKGVSYMEDQLEWHYRSPNPQQLEQALLELSQESL